jgi:hypothetical protein
VGVGNTEVALPDKEGLVKLFQLLMEQAWYFFVKVSKLLIKFLKVKGYLVLKYFRNHPWVTSYVAFASCALLVLHYLCKKFGKKLRWYDYLFTIILSLLAIYLLALVIKSKSFKIIRDWLKSIIVNLVLTLYDLNTSLDEYFQKSEPDPFPELYKSSKSNANGFQTFVVFSVLTVITSKLLLKRFKRQLVGQLIDEGPFTDIMVYIIDHDKSDVPDFVRY